MQTGGDAMATATKVILVACCLLLWMAPLYAQVALTPTNALLNLPSKENSQPQVQLQAKTTNPSEPIELQKKLAHATFKTLYNKPYVNEKKVIRTQWQQALGVDVWVPYYKAKEIEDRVSDKFSVKVFKLKGKPKCDENECRYTFSTKF